MIELLIILLCSCWSILINRFTPYLHFKDSIGMGYSRTLVSDNIFVEYILYILHGVLTCVSCFSAWLLFFTWLIYFGTFTGFLLMPICYILTYFIEEKIMSISL